MNAALDGQPSHRSRVVGRGRIAVVAEGVELEEQIPIPERGAVPFSRAPLVDALQV